jgi:integrase
MARPSPGQVVVDQRGRSRIYALRFRAYGKRRYVTLGSDGDGWTRARAELELQNVLADVRRGIWRPIEPAPAPQVVADPSFHEFASRWYDGAKDEWRAKTRLDYHWQLTRHLLPFFKDYRLSQITIAEVDRYRQKKVAEAQMAVAEANAGRPRFEEYVDRNGVTRRRPDRGLSPTSINKTITRLGQILEVAVEYGLIQSNPAKGRRRRLRASAPAPIWLDSAEQVTALLDAGGQLDRQALVSGGREHHGGTAYRRALLAVLVFGGLRISELTAERCRPGRESPLDQSIQDRRWDTHSRSRAGAPARAHRAQRADAGSVPKRVRIPVGSRQRTQAAQHPQARAREVRRPRKRNPRSAWTCAASRRAHPPQATSHIRVHSRR